MIDDYKYLPVRLGGRTQGKTFFICMKACLLTMYARKKVLMVVPDKKTKDRYSRYVEDICQGAWPIGLKIKTPEELLK